MTDSLEAKSPPPSTAPSGNDPQLDSLRAILLDEERSRIHQLEQETEALQEKAQRQSEVVAGQLRALQAEVEALRQANQQQETELEHLRQAMHQDSQSLIPKLIQQMGFIISNTIREKRDELAEALGPIMSDAIRVQIRDSRKEMVEALYPIILETVMRAVSEYLREFQRNIDARLKSTLNLRGFLKRTGARLRGVSPSELALRESFSFSIEELFLIQHETGLLLAHHSPSNEENSDSDLIGGMLTAIRDFARDSFGEGDAEQELREIEFGDERIIIQSGQYLYAAAVIKGIEPTGFHARLQEMVSELHISYKPALRDYDGDPATLPDLMPAIAAFSTQVLTPEKVDGDKFTRGQRWLIFGGAGITLLFTAVACFYLQFTIALWPVAFGAPPTPTSTAAPTTLPLPTGTPSPVPTMTFTPQPTNMATETAVPPTQTATMAPSATATATLAPTVTSTTTPAPALPVTVRPVWLRDEPDLNAPPTVALPANTAVTVLDRLDDWVRVSWQSGDGLQEGWLGVTWLAVDGVPFSAVATPPGE